MSTPKTQAPAEAAPHAGWLIEHADVRIPHYVPTSADEELLDEAAGLKAVSDAADYEYGVELVKKLAGATKRVEAFFTPWKQFLDRLKRPVLDSEHEHAGNYDRERQRVNRLCKAWYDAEREKERQARQKAEREAEEKARQERDERAARLKAEAERQADPAVAAAVAREAEQVAASTPIPTKVNVESAIPAVPGYTPSRVTYKAEGQDLAATVRAIAGPAIAAEARQALAAGHTAVDVLGSLLASLEAHRVPLDAVQYNQKRIDQAARDSGEALKWPGVKVVKGDGTAVRG